MRIHFTFIIALFALVQLQSQSVFDQATTLSSKRAYEASSSLLLNYIEEHPQRKYDIARAWWMHSYNLLKRELFADAMQANEQSLVLRKELRLDEASANYLRQAEIHLVQENYVKSLNAAQRGMQFMIEDAALFAALNIIGAKAFVGLKQYEDALRYLETALSTIEIELGKQHQLYSSTALYTAFIAFHTKDEELIRNLFEEVFIHTNSRFVSVIAGLGAVAKYRF